MNETEILKANILSVIKQDIDIALGSNEIKTAEVQSTIETSTDFNTKNSDNSTKNFDVSFRNTRSRNNIEGQEVRSSSSSLIKKRHKSFHSDDNDDDSEGNNAKPPSLYSSSLITRRVRRNDINKENWADDNTALRKKEISGKKNMTKLRSNSAGPRGRKKISRNLEATQEKYIMKVKAAKEREKLQKLEMDKLENERRERQKRAATNGTEFKAMMMRQELAEKKNMARRDKKLQEENERQIKETQERKDALRKSIDAGMRGDSDKMTWKERQEMEQLKRSKRIEERKQQLMSKSKLPSGMERKNNVIDSKKQSQSNSTDKYEFKAEDPKKVAARMDQYRELGILQREKEAARKKGREKVNNKTDDSFFESINNRQIEYQSRYRAQLEKREEADKAKEEKDLAKELLKTQRLMNVNLPIPQPTKSSELQLQKVKYKI